MTVKWKSSGLGAGASALIALALMFAPVDSATGSPVVSSQRASSAQFDSLQRGRPRVCPKVNAGEVSPAKRGPGIKGVFLGLSARRYHPGQVLFGRLVNMGANTGNYGAPFRIERYVQSEWVLDPVTPDAWPKWLAKLDPGDAGRCYVLALPVDQPPGLYRLVTFVNLEGRRRLLVKFWVG
jgi:hypothetical protein